METLSWLAERLLVVFWSSGTLLEAVISSKVLAGGLRSPKSGDVGLEPPVGLEAAELLEAKAGIDILWIFTSS
jgi:hypothetical protein